MAMEILLKVFMISMFIICYLYMEPRLILILICSTGIGLILAVPHDYVAVGSRMGLQSCLISGQLYVMQSEKSELVASIPLISTWMHAKELTRNTLAQLAA